MRRSGWNGFLAVVVTGLLASAPAAFAYELQISPADPTISESGGLLQVQVSLLGCPTPQSTVPVGVQLIPITADFGSDFGAPMPTVLVLGDDFPSVTLSVPIVSDSLPESNETFEILLDLSNSGPLECGFPVPTPPASFFYQEVVTILDDDTVPTPTVSISDAQVTEGDQGSTELVFPVNLSAATTFPITLQVSTRDGTAIAAEDYVPRSTTLEIPAGQTSVPFVVEVLGDTVDEQNEVFFADLGSVDGADVVDGVAQGTIVDDDEGTPPATPSFSIRDARVVEGDSGTTSMEFTVELEPVSEVTASVLVTTSDGTAQAGSDYEATSERLTFPAGASLRTFQVPVLGDTVVEEDETLTATLSEPAGAEILPGEGSATGVIQDDDDDTPPPSEPELRIRNTSVVEGDTGARTASFTVNLDPPSEETVTVGYRTENGSATAGEDYQATAGTLSFQPGQGAQTVGVAVVGDVRIENDETFFVVLEAPSGATVVDGRGRGTIVNDDSVAPPAEIVVEGSPEQQARPGGEVELVVRVTRDGEPASGIEVTWTLEGDAGFVGGATSTSDANGVARKIVRLGSRTGRVVVTATVPGGSVEHFIEVLRSLQSLFPDEPGERSVAGVLDGACQAPGELGPLCRYLGGLDDPDARRAVSELTPRESAAMGRLGLEGARSQLDNIDAHLAAVRRSGRLGGSRVALGLGDRSWEPTELWRIATGRSDGASPVSGLASSLVSTATTQGGDDPLVDDPSRAAFFASGRVSTGDRGESGREAGFDFDTLGLTAGFDFRVGPGLVLGLAGGYLDTSTDFARDGGELAVDGYTLTGFLTRYGDHGWLDLVAGWGTNEYSLRRNVDLPIPFAGSSRYLAQGSPDGDQLSASLAVGADWGRAFTFGIFAGVSWVDGTIDAYSETDGGATALTFEEQTLESLLTEAGFELSYAASFSWGVFLPQVRVAYLHEAEDDPRLIRGRFSLDGRGQEFVLPTEVYDRNYLDVGVGFTATFARGRSFYLYWETDLDRDDLEADHISGGLRLEL